MSLKLSDWADLSQIVSVIAVVVTLVFLIFEICNNTSVTRAAVWERSADRLMHFRSTSRLTSPSAMACSALPNGAGSKGSYARRTLAHNRPRTSPHACHR